MADLNALIAQGAKFDMPNPINQMAQMMQMRHLQDQSALAPVQLQHAQQQNQMNQLLMQEKQRGFQEQNAVRTLMGRPGFTLANPEHVRELHYTAPNIADPIYKNYLANTEMLGKIAAQPGDAAHKEAQTGELNEKTLDLQLTNFNKRFSPLSVNGPDDVRAYTIAMYNDPKLGPLATRMKSLDEALQTNLTEFARDPNMWKVAHSNVSGKDIFEALKGTRKDVNLGNVSRGSTVNAFGNVVPGSQVDTSIGPVASTEAAMMQARAAQQQAGTSAGRLKVEQDRLAQDSNAVTYLQNEAGQYNALPSRLAAGAAPVPRPVLTAEGVPLKAKPTAFAEKQAAAKVQLQKDLGFAITELSDAIKEGGLIDQSTGSGAGRLADISAGFFGQATPGAIAIGKLQPIADLPLKLVTRFEGPQSNADTKSYKEASAQLADPTLPRAIRKAAGATVVRLMKERQGQFVTNDMAPTVENAAKGNWGKVEVVTP